MYHFTVVITLLLKRAAVRILCLYFCITPTIDYQPRPYMTPYYTCYTCNLHTFKTPDIDNKQNFMFYLCLPSFILTPNGAKKILHFLAVCIYSCCSIMVPSSIVVSVGCIVCMRICHYTFYVESREFEYERQKRHTKDQFMRQRLYLNQKHLCEVGYLGLFWLNAKLLLFYAISACMRVCVPGSVFIIDKALISIWLFGQSKDKRIYSGVIYLYVTLRQNLYRDGLH